MGASDTFLTTQIQPTSLPDAAAIEYAGGDVRHMSPEDPVNSVNISNATRNLAYRDNVLAAAINQLVSVVNNKESLAPLLAPPTYVSQGQAVIAANYRVPAGFEARIVNAAVSSQPANAVLLEVLQSTNTYGQQTGVIAVSTYTEFTAGTSFYPPGELILRMTNTGTTGAEATAAVLVSLRPTIAQAGAILGPGIIGEPGPPGPPGGPGAAGIGLPGPPGINGLNWRGVYNALSNYAQDDGVSFNWGPGIGVASYINLVASIGIAPPAPALAPSTNWGLLAYAAPTNPDSVIAPLVASGSLTLGEIFGYFVAPYAGMAVQASVFVQTPPAGGSTVIDLVNSLGQAQGLPLSIPAGVQIRGTTFATPLVLTAGQTLQAKIVTSTGSVAGANVTYQLWYEAANT